MQNQKNTRAGLLEVKIDFKMRCKSKKKQENKKKEFTYIIK
jgi:hypothetical protein